MATIFRKKYKDDQLINVAEHAVNDDPTVDVALMKLTSKDGIITVSGAVKTGIAKRHAIDAIEKALKRANLKVQQVVDNLTVQ